MPATAAQNEWVERVLGFSFAGAALRGRPKTADVPAIWRVAKEAVDIGLGKLADKLGASGDPDLERIGGFGLYGIGRNENVSLKRALFEFATAAPERRIAAGAGLRKAVSAYRTLLTQQPVVSLIDRNPFGIPVGLQDRLGAALNEIERALT